MRARTLLLPLMIGTALGVAGCSKKAPPANSLDAMDNDLVNGSITDEAAARKLLAGSIQVDPKRAKHRAASTDRTATVSLAEMAQRQAKGGKGMPTVNEGGAGLAPCTDGLAYSNAWAKQLPSDLPMHPQATLQEAAGHDGACSIRIVSFAVPGDRGAVLAWYEAKAKAAGYSAERVGNGSDLDLQGSKDDSSYLIMAGPPNGGATPIDYIWTKDE